MAAETAQARLRFEQGRRAEALATLDAAEARAQALGAPAKGVLAEAKKLRERYAPSGSSS